MIWCVDDDRSIRELEVYALRQMGFQARGFEEGESVLSALLSETPRLILLDVMLPGVDGITLLKRLKADPKTACIPVIMATAAGEENARIEGLDLGAEDYLVKPFGIMEMVCRVKAVLRRCEREVKKTETLSFEGITLSEKSHRVTTADGEVVLTLKEFELLRLFLQNPGTVLTRDRILTEVWGNFYIGESRTVDVHIKTLRQKLGKQGGLIKTVIGVGYCLRKE